MPQEQPSFGNGSNEISSTPHGSGADAGATWDHKFQGMRFDPKDTVLCERQRAYSPTLKAWMQDDPCGHVDGLNWYNAPPDEPINPINPLGT